MQLHEVPVEFSLSLLEVKTWYFDFLSFKKFIELLPQEFEIHRFKGFKVVFSVLVTWSMFPVDEIIVEFNDFRVEAENAALDSQSFGCRCLSAA